MKSIKLISFLLAFGTINFANGQVSNDTFKEAIWAGYDSYKQVSADQYKVFQDISGAHPTDPTLIVNYTMTMVMQNMGDHYTIVAGFPSLLPHVYDDICEGDGKFSLNDILDHQFGKVKKVTEYTHTQGDEFNPIIVIKSEFGGKSSIAVMGNMIKATTALSKSWAGVAGQQQRLVFGGIKEFQKGKVESIDNPMLPYYFDYDKLAEFEKEPDIDGAVGKWSFVNSGIGIDYDLYNFSDRFEIWITSVLEDGENRDNYTEEIENFIKRNKYKKASSTRVATLENTGYAGVIVSFNYDGKTSGQDIIDGFNEYYNYGNRLSKIFD